ncbi:MAG: hypothetical protein KBT87_13180 [Gammaproteobacteria bacterium]|jgi:hypothetical protein|nr:hypothetical protein [Gammaproteobacteria bacterium]MBQ0775623.1 hypothetical protein [Gammaproteobacteria bacterium]
MPLLYVFPSIPFKFNSGEGGLTVWSNWGFSYCSSKDGDRYDIFLGSISMLGKDATTARAHLGGPSVISPDGTVIAPFMSEVDKYESAMKAYRQRFPGREFDADNNDVIFFPDAVNIIDCVNYEYEGMNYVFHYSLENGEIENLESPNIGVCRIFPSGICVHLAPRGKKIVAVDSRLRKLWTIGRNHLDPALCAVDITDGPTHDTVLLNLGYVDIKDSYGRDNEVALVEQASGRCLWKVTFPEVINSIWADEIHVYVSSQGSAYVLDRINGEIVKKLGQVFNIESIRERYHPEHKIHGATLKSSLVSDGRHLYFFNVSYMHFSSSHCSEFWIFDANTLECLRHDDLPKGMSVKHNVEPRFLNGKLYVSMTSSFWGSEGGALVEFNPDDIYSDFVFDVDVPFEESVRQNGDAQEYVLETRHLFLNDILRYGESELKNLAIARGRCVFSKKVKNPAFNGVIHFALKKALLSEEGAEEKLAVLMKRLNAWGQSGYYASDGKTFVSFQWEASVL